MIAAGVVVVEGCWPEGYLTRTPPSMHQLYKFTTWRTKLVNTCWDNDFIYLEPAEVEPFCTAVIARFIVLVI